MAVDLPLVIDPGDVLAQPTRARLFALLGELRRAAGTVELAERLGLHPNGVRVHLERMEQAGLLARRRTPRPRGRPRDAWAIAPGARPGGSAPRAYADLGHWLARVIPSSSGERPDVEEVGRKIGRELSPKDAPPGGDALAATLSALGFQPSVERTPDGHRTTYCLGNCPYKDAVRQNSEVVCALHKGMTRGLLDVLAPGSELAGFVACDPDVAGCQVEVMAAK